MWAFNTASPIEDWLWFCSRFMPSLFNILHMDRYFRTISGVGFNIQTVFRSKLMQYPSLILPNPTTKLFTNAMVTIYPDWVIEVNPHNIYVNRQITMNATSSKITLHIPLAGWFHDESVRLCWRLTQTYLLV